MICWILIACLLVSPALCQTAEQDLARKPNLVSVYLNKVLEEKFKELTSKNHTLPELNLGSDVARIWNLKASFSGGLTKNVDGFKTFGFKLNTDAKGIELNGKYDIKNLDVPGLFPIYGEGDLHIGLELLTLNLFIDARYNLADNKFDVKMPSFEIGAENATVKFDNLMNDPFITSFLNELISNLIPDVVTALNAPLREVLNGFIDKYGSGIFLCIKEKPLKLKECIDEVLRRKLTDIEQLIVSKLTGIITSLK